MQQPDLYLFDLLEKMHEQFLTRIGALSRARHEFGVRRATGSPAMNYHASPPRELTLDDELHMIGKCHYGVYHPYNYAVELVDHLAGVNEALFSWLHVIREDVDRIGALMDCDASLLSTLTQVRILEGAQMSGQIERQLEVMTRTVDAQRAKILTADAVLGMTADNYGDLPFLPSDTLLDWLRDIHETFPKTGADEQLGAAHEEYISWRRNTLLEIRRTICETQGIAFEEPAKRRAGDSAFTDFASSLF